VRSREEIVQQIENYKQMQREIVEEAPVSGQAFRALVRVNSMISAWKWVLKESEDE